MKTIYLASHFQNNMNTWGVGNMCCTVDYQVAESVGKDKLRDLCKDIRGGGARPQMWANSAISVLSWIFAWDRKEDGPSARIDFLPYDGSVMQALKQSAAPFVRNPSNAIEADHYTPIFCVLNLRDATVREYWLRRWKEAHDEIGLGGIFLDSSFNLSSDKFHWVQNTNADKMSVTADEPGVLGYYRPATQPRAEILSQYRAHLSLMARMQKIGYVYANEDLGVFGIHRAHGPAVEKRLSSLFLWSDCITDFDAVAIQNAGLDPDDIFFKGLAYRLMWCLHWNIEHDALCFRYSGPRGDIDLPAERHIALFKAFNEVSERMKHREILPDEKGVLYHDGHTKIVWSFDDFEMHLPFPSTIRDVWLGETDTGSVLNAAKHRLYIIDI